MGQKLHSLPILLVALVGQIFCSFLPLPTIAAMSSTSYEIKWDTISNGGGDAGSSASYRLHDTVGNPAIGRSDSASYGLLAGYRQGETTEVLSFDVRPQFMGFNVIATAKVGNTITVGSASAFSVGGYVLIVQDQGASQVSGFGVVTATTATTVTFDSIADNGTAPVIDGTNDYLYALAGAITTFGAVESGAVYTTVIAWETTADFDGGYTVQVYEDGDLRDGAETISDVADGTVTASSEEYGARASDLTLATSTFDTQDTAITGTPQAISTIADRVYDDRYFMTLKLSTSTATEDGNYQHELIYIVTGNY